MKTEVKGASTCPAGEENYEEFRLRGMVRIQYDYRTPDGKLFSCVTANLKAARRQRNAWLKEASKGARRRK